MASPTERAAAFAWLDSLGNRGIEPGLERIAALTAALGRPERRFPSVLVAGTNGKGSTTASLDAILRAAGYRTGFYSSPHLVRITERLRLSGEEVEVDRLADALVDVRRLVEGAGEGAAAKATWFEAMTAAAFSVLASSDIDLALLEVGLGGRCDATNLAPAILSIVTPLGLDHVEMLGGSLASIAREKAGIFKTARPALAAPQPDEAMAVLRRTADGVRAPLDVLDPATIAGVGVSRTGTRFRLESPFGPLELETPLAGRHQATNAALAVQAAAKLRELGFDRIDVDAVRRGVAATRWPGRLDRRLVGGQPWLVDGCHNPHGAAAAAAFLDEVGLSREVVLLLGVLADKDAAGIAGPLARRARAVVTTRPPGVRGRPAEELAEVVRREAPNVPVAAEEELAAALDRARDAAPNRETILVAGSLLLAGETLRILETGADEAG